MKIIYIVQMNRMPEWTKAARIIFAIAASGWGCISLLRSGVRPGTLDSPKWYDRTLRVVGGILMGCLCAGILMMAFTGKL